ncbi:hypothetical protein [Planktothrix agardhii]|uniref:hypothetical protein n=1 Tax=Planktothrix agardhii TaxID=1160 RepID=UPI001D0A4902|nr:hypothetical protein [Planktothrix agardhii]MCB8766764.1 hypothetical protein [Planktothrix agardhii 1809]MCB8784193.1 hypothetical protein [Planktothrix agardhii 1808]MCF3564786.1 hypothetical protein [Planktothrix agardhii 1807]
MKYKNIREEELKNKVGADWFKQFDTTEILGNIDFTVFPKNDSLFGRTPLLWAEAKTGNFDVSTMFVQLILTIGKARTFDKTLPPAFLGAFDFKKIAFVEYSNVQDIFYLNDFNWNVTPSNHETKEFRLIKERIESTLKENTYVFDFEKDDKELRTFIKDNIANATTISKIKIDKNNFIPIYLRWIETVKPIINVNWEELKKANILDSDFYLADLFVDDKDTQNIEDDSSIRDNLFVVFQNQGYKIAKENLKQMFDATINIKNKDIYSQFWKLYKRPPLKEFQDYIIERRDLLTPQDIRERKGAFFTPRIWVELSQKYLTDYLGENWQDDYTIWDCAAGTGNLLAGLTNKYNIYASTLDQADVNVMHERIEHGANLLKNHVFQFDFLNDDFTKLPQSLQDIINDEEKRKKLVIYLNPPYAEGGSSKQKTGTGDYKKGVNENKTHDKYHDKLSGGNRELFAQFLARIYFEIPNSKIAEFSTLKILQSSHFLDFRQHFRAKIEKVFLVPADTFDNVKGKFPIGFKIWNTNKKDIFKEIEADIYDKKESFIGTKILYSYEDFEYYSKFVNSIKLKTGFTIGWLEGTTRNSFQHNSIIQIVNSKEQMAVPRGMFVFSENLIKCCVCYSVRKAIDATWLNDRDQFLFPNDGWQNDTEFQNDCFIYTLFNNNIQSKFGTNHWIPFTEQEVNAQNKFESHFMTDFINGKMKVEEETVLFGSASSPNQKREFSAEAKAVFDAGRELWSYYHKQPNVNVNASLYDIREYFQGRNEKGRMNSKSNDAHYMQLIGELRNQLNFLADKIKPKIYEYEFLKE